TIACSGIAVTSSRRSSISGSAAMAAVTSAAKTSRSTVSAWPPGTRAVWAARSSREPRRLTSSFRSQGAVDSDSDFNELLHTSSASRSVRCAGVGRAGRISCSTAGSPRRAICQAASQPARPPPIISIVCRNDHPLFFPDNRHTPPNARRYTQEMHRAFLDYSAKKLQQLGSRIETCLNTLNQDQVWARGSDNENAVGNLVLHLCGNVRQWIVSGVGGQPDTRDRDAEFLARGCVPVSELAR